MSNKSLLFYKQPTMLDKVKHKNLKLKKLSSLEFASDVNSVPVAGVEFFSCSRNFPVMFVKNANEGFIPIAVLSLTPQGHHLGDQWQDVYIPSFVRRYPFVLEASQGMVMFDETSSALQEEEGDALFDEAGEPTKTLQDIMEFLKSCDRSYRQTEEFSKALQDKGLLEPFKGTVKFSDTTLKLDHLHVIDEKKLYDSLTDEDIVAWFKNGWMAWIHAHLHSISAISEVVKRMPSQAETKPT